MFLQVTYSRISKVVRQVFCKLLCQTLLTNALRTDEHQHRIWTLQNWQRSGHKDSRPDYASEMKDEVKYAQKIPCISELKQGSFASHSTVYVALWTEKSNLLNSVSIRTLCRVRKLQQVFEVQSFGLDTFPQSFCHLFIPLSIIRWSKSAHCLGVSSCLLS